VKEIKATRKHIVQFLTFRFGPRSSELQVKVGELKDPAVADRVFAELLIATEISPIRGVSMPVPLDLGSL